jgi:formylmethanofuran dehydrogenase subunit E
VGGCRAIPLYISRELFSRAVATLGEGYVLSVLPLRKARAGVLITGTEVFQGLVEDKFLAVVTAKLEQLKGMVVDAVIVPDDSQAIHGAVRKLMGQGIDLLITTGGMSVDPEDMTRSALMGLGMEDVLYGVPVLPGTMMMIGRLAGVQVLGVPACALYHKTTGFDLLLPRLLAGKEITRKDLAAMSVGGYCLGCQSCTFPKCSYGK